MAYRFTARSAVPGEYGLKHAAIVEAADYPAEAQVSVGVDYANANLTGTLSAGAAPATPTLSVVNVGDGASVTATVAGEALATHTLYYRTADATAWTAGETRVGDGTITQAGLVNNAGYRFRAISTLAGAYSLPSADAVLFVTSGDLDLLAALAAAVVARLNAGSYSQTFTASRAIVPEHKLRELSALTVQVVPKSALITAVTRADDRHELTVDVGVMQRLSGLAATDGDPYLQLQQEIVRHMRRTNLSLESAGATRTAVWESAELQPYSVDHAREARVWLGVVTLTYWVHA